VLCMPSLCMPYGRRATAVTGDASQPCQKEGETLRSLAKERATVRALHALALHALRATGDRHDGGRFAEGAEPPLNGDVENPRALCVLGVLCGKIRPYYYPSAVTRVQAVSKGHRRPLATQTERPRNRLEVAAMQPGTSRCASAGTENKVGSLLFLLAIGAC